VFQSNNGGIRVHGRTGALLWGYHRVATFRAWRISQVEGHWILRATLERVDKFQIRQRPLLFSAPRDRGFWCWGVESVTAFDTVNLLARLGPPEQ
jgi:hypothetical protein